MFRKLQAKIWVRLVFMLLLGIGLPLLPLPFHVSWFAQIANPAEFLRALWQVVGVTLALSFAVIAFALEPLRENDPTSLKEIVEESGIQWFLILGVGALFAIGTALIAGETNPHTSATTWALVLAALALVSIPLLFASALRAIQPEALHERRILRVRQLGALEVRDDLLQRIAYAHLDNVAKDVGFHFSIFRRRPPGSGFKPIRAERDGRVMDIKLDRLRRLSKDLGAGNLYLVIRIGDFVRSTSEVAWIPSGAAISQRRVRRVFKIG